MTSRTRFSFRAAALAAAAAVTVWAAATPPTFVERAGLVSLEAEQFTDNVGAWEEVEGRNADAPQRGFTSDSALHLMAAGHALAGSFSTDLELPPGTLVPWGFPAPTATVAFALASDPRKAVLFGYERGASMPGGVAAARRVQVPVTEANSPEALWKLVEAGLRWAAEGTGSKTVLFTTNQHELEEDESLLRERIGRWGYTIKSVRAIDAQPADAEGCAALFVPARVRVEKIGERFNSTAVPVVTSKSHLAQFLGMVPPVVASRPGDNALLVRAGAPTDRLRYAFHVAEAGEYRVWLLGRSGGDAGSDEALVSLNDFSRETLSSAAEVRLPAQLGWSGSSARLRVTTPGWQNLFVLKGDEPLAETASAPTRRYPNWRVDKIVLARAADWTPTGDGPPETRASGNVPALPRDLAAQPEWRPRQVWAARDGVVVVEAEEIDHHPHWVLKTEPTGYTGRGYLDWRGPGRSKSIEGLGGNDDALHVRQGPPEEWLIVRVHVAEAGAYRIDARNFHLLKDGDNDTWLAPVGHRATPEAPIKRLVDSHRDGTGFTWGDSTAQAHYRYEFVAGLNEVYLGGRSVGFGVDRIALYRDGDEEAKRRALDPATPPSSLHAE